MKRILSVLCSTVLLLPLSALAGDVTAVGGPTLVLPSDGSEYTIVSGTFDSVDINNGTFTFVLSAGSSVELSSADKKKLTNSKSVATECKTSESRLFLSIPSGSASETVTVTPSGTCSASGGDSGSGAGGGGSSSGGGGGGGSVSSSPIALNTATPSATSAASQTPPASPVVSSSVSTSPQSTVQTAIVLTRDLSLGVEGDDVRQLQELLAKDPLIYPEGRVTGYYGAMTRTAVRRFQTKYGLPPVGRVGPQTRARIAELSVSGLGGVVGGQLATPVSPPSASISNSAGTGSALVLGRNLDDGFEGDDVRELQTYLAADPTLYPEGIVSGYFGPKTRRAVGRFQERYGIVKEGDIAYGYVGQKTRAKLLEISSGSSGSVR